MDCEHAHVRVYEYLDGELTVWKRRAITRHLDDCPPCAEGFSFEIELRRVIVSKCGEQVPAELKARIAAALGIAAPGDPQVTGPQS
jgi:mycothiol system anti-sigma-R factor